MDAWKVKDFDALCHDLGLDKACLYADSLSIRWSTARYHKHNIQQNINKLNKINETHIITFPNDVADYTSEFNFELDDLMLTLYSIFDILGQLINECFVKTDSSEVSFSKFSNPKECCYRLIPPEIQQILKSIRGNTLYQKIRAYANVSKHRYVIQGTNRIDFTKIPTTVSYESTEFEYNGEWHKLTKDDAFRCWEFVGKSVIQVGTKTQELLKAGNFTQFNQTQARGV